MRKKIQNKNSDINDEKYSYVAHFSLVFVFVLFSDGYKNHISGEQRELNYSGG